MRSFTLFPLYSLLIRQYLSKPKVWLRCVALLLVVCFVTQDVAWAASELNGKLKIENGDEKQKHLSWAKKLLPDIPESVATIEDAYLVGSRELVLLIQDAHTNSSCQMNEAKLLDILRPTTVFMEAGSGDESLSFLRPYASLQKRQQVAKSYVLQGKMQGVEYLDLTSDHDFKIYGVEDMSLYAQSVDLYRAIAAKREKYEEYLNRVDGAIDSLKSKLLNPFLAAFVDKMTSHERGDMTSIDYISFLLNHSERLGLSVSSLDKIREIRSIEKSIDFDRVQKEQVEFIASLPEDERRELLEASRSKDEAVRSGFMMTLREKLIKSVSSRGAQHGKNLIQYLDYFHTTQSIDASMLLKEQKLLEQSILDSLILSPTEKQFISTINSAVILRKILKLTITPQEYESYKKDQPAHDIRKITGFLNQQLMIHKDAYDKAVYLEDGYADMIQKCEQFYELTYQRDQKFLENMFNVIPAAKNVMPSVSEGSSTHLDSSASPRNDTSILITGGFHTPNLKYLLKQKGISYISLTPQVLQETNQKRYEEILLHQKMAAPSIPSAPIGIHTNMPLRILSSGGLPALAARLAESPEKVNEIIQMSNSQTQGALTGARLTKADNNFFPNSTFVKTLGGEIMLKDKNGLGAEFERYGLVERANINAENNFLAVGQMRFELHKNNEQSAYRLWINIPGDPWGDHGWHEIPHDILPGDFVYIRRGNIPTTLSKSDKDMGFSLGSQKERIIVTFVNDYHGETIYYLPAEKGILDLGRAHDSSLMKEEAEVKGYNNNFFYTAKKSTSETSSKVDENGAAYVTRKDEKFELGHISLEYLRDEIFSVGALGQYEPIHVYRRKSGARLSGPITQSHIPFEEGFTDLRKFRWEDFISTDTFGVEQRILDVFVSSMLLVPTLLVTGLLGLAISVVDRQWPYISQERLGLGGKTFFAYKLNTMKVRDGRASPTALGQWLRVTGLDELPQVFNIFKGEMSLFGPRPFAVDENTTSPIQEVFQTRKPGLLSLFAVVKGAGRSVSLDSADKELTYEKVMEFDVYERDHWSPPLMISILAVHMLNLIRMLAGESIRYPAISDIDLDETVSRYHLPPTHPDFEKATEIFIAAAKRANEEIILPMRKAASIPYEEKVINGTVSRVSIADKEAQKMVLDEVMAHMPTSIRFRIIAEEELHDTAKKHNEENAYAPYVLTLDPIDGTSAFMDPERTEFGTAMSLSHIDKKNKKLRIVSSVFYAPLAEVIRGQRGTVFSSHEDMEGIQINDQVVTDKLSTIKIIESDARVFIHRDLNDPRLYTEGIRVKNDRFSSAFEFALLANGQYDHVGAYARRGDIAIWDLLPGLYLVQKSGGVFKTLDGSPLRVSIDDIESILSGESAHRFFGTSFVLGIPALVEHMLGRREDSERVEQLLDWIEKTAQSSRPEVRASVFSEEVKQQFDLTESVIDRWRVEKPELLFRYLLYKKLIKERRVPTLASDLAGTLVDFTSTEKRIFPSVDRAVQEYLTENPLLLITGDPFKTARDGFLDKFADENVLDEDQKHRLTIFALSGVEQYTYEVKEGEGSDFMSSGLVPPIRPDEVDTIKDMLLDITANRVVTHEKLRSLLSIDVDPLYLGSQARPQTSLGPGYIDIRPSQGGSIIAYLPPGKIADANLKKQISGDKDIQALFLSIVDEINTRLKPINEKRTLEQLPPIIAKQGGKTTIDITTTDKGVGLAYARENRLIKDNEYFVMLGDSIYPGGNDDPAMTVAEIGVFVGEKNKKDLSAVYPSNHQVVFAKETADAGAVTHYVEIVGRARATARALGLIHPIAGARLSEISIKIEQNKSVYIAVSPKKGKTAPFIYQMQLRGEDLWMQKLGSFESSAGTQRQLSITDAETNKYYTDGSIRLFNFTYDREASTLSFVSLNETARLHDATPEISTILEDYQKIGTAYSSAEPLITPVRVEARSSIYKVGDSRTHYFYKRTSSKPLRAKTEYGFFDTRTPKEFFRAIYQAVNIREIPLVWPTEDIEITQDHWLVRQEGQLTLKDLFDQKDDELALLAIRLAVRAVSAMARTGFLVRDPTAQNFVLANTKMGEKDYLFASLHDMEQALGYLENMTHGYQDAKGTHHNNPQLYVITDYNVIDFLYYLLGPLIKVTVKIEKKQPLRRMDNALQQETWRGGYADSFKKAGFSSLGSLIQEDNFPEFLMALAVWGRMIDGTDNASKSGLFKSMSQKYRNIIDRVGQDFIYLRQQGRPDRFLPVIEGRIEKRLDGSLAHTTVDEAETMPAGARLALESQERAAVAWRSMTHGAAALGMVETLQQVAQYVMTWVDEESSKIEDQESGVDVYKRLNTLAELIDIKSDSAKSISIEDGHLNDLVSDIVQFSREVEQIAIKINDLYEKNPTSLWLKEAHALLPSMIKIAESRRDIATSQISGDTFSISTLLEDIRKNYKNISIETPENMESIHIRGNIYALKSALFNLLDNAKFFAGKEGRYGLRVETLPQSSQIQISVWDSGASIPSELLQIDPETQRPMIFNLNSSQRPGGTGLGLTEAFYAIKDLGGSIQVPDASALEKAFVVTLPWTYGIHWDHATRKTMNDSHGNPATGFEIIDKVSLNGPDVFSDIHFFVLDRKYIQAENVYAEDVINRPVGNITSDQTFGKNIQKWREESPDRDRVILGVTSHQSLGIEKNMALVHDGKLILRPADQSGLNEGNDPQPLNGIFTFVVFDEKRPGIQSIHLVDGAPVDDTGVPMTRMPFKEGLAGVHFFKEGKLAANDIVFTKGGPTRAGNETNWSGLDHRLSMTIYAVTESGKIVIFQAIGNPDDPIHKEVSIVNIARALQQISEKYPDLKIKDAIIGGTSGDVQAVYEDKFVYAKARTGSTIQKAVQDESGVRRLPVALLFQSKSVSDAARLADEVGSESWVLGLGKESQEEYLKDMEKAMRGYRSQARDLASLDAAQRLWHEMKSSFLPLSLHEKDYLQASKYGYAVRVQAAEYLIELLESAGGERLLEAMKSDGGNDFGLKPEMGMKDAVQFLKDRIAYFEETHKKASTMNFQEAVHGFKLAKQVHLDHPESAELESAAFQARDVLDFQRASTENTDETMVFLEGVFEAQKRQGSIVIHDSIYLLEVDQRIGLLTIKNSQNEIIRQTRQWKRVQKSLAESGNESLVISAADIRSLVGEALRKADGVASDTHKKALIMIDVDKILDLKANGLHELTLPLLMLEIKRLVSKDGRFKVHFLTSSEVMKKVLQESLEKPEFQHLKSHIVLADDEKPYDWEEYTAHTAYVTAPGYGTADQRNFYMKSLSEGDIANFRAALSLALAEARIGEMTTVDPDLLRYKEDLQRNLGIEIQSVEDLLAAIHAHKNADQASIALPPIMKVAINAILQAARLAIRMSEQSA